MTSLRARAFGRFRALPQRPGGFVPPDARDGASAALFRRAGSEAVM